MRALNRVLLRRETMEFTTFNVTSNTRADLKPRLPLLVNTIAKMVKSRRYIALQEVDKEMEPAFDAVFDEKNYRVIKTLNQDTFNSWLCIPLDYAVVLSESLECVDDVKTQNVVIVATVRDLYFGQEFVLATYKMPDVGMQIAHTDSLLRIVQEKAGSKARMIMGDFNTTLDTDLYTLCVTRIFYNEEPRYTALMDAGASDRGRITQWNADFARCTDFLFYSNHWKMLEYRGQQMREAGPDVNWGSDHAPATALFVLPAVLPAVPPA